MTSEEIKQKEAFDLSTNAWLREVAMQIALLNEKGSPEPRVKRPYTKRT